MSSSTVESTGAAHLGIERAVTALVIATLSVICVTSIGDERLAGVVHNGHINRWAGLALFWSGEVGTIPAGGREASRLPERAWPGRRERWTAPTQQVHAYVDGAQTCPNREFAERHDRFIAGAHH